MLSIIYHPFFFSQHTILTVQLSIIQLRSLLPDMHFWRGKALREKDLFLNIVLILF
jgi:hypothetical protein